MFGSELRSRKGLIVPADTVGECDSPDQQAAKGSEQLHHGYAESRHAWARLRGKTQRPSIVTQACATVPARRCVHTRSHLAL